MPCVTAVRPRCPAGSPQRNRRAVERLCGALGRSQRDLPLSGGARTRSGRQLSSARPDAGAPGVPRAGTVRALTWLARRYPGRLSPCVTPAAEMLVGKASCSLVVTYAFLHPFDIPAGMTTRARRCRTPRKRGGPSWHGAKAKASVPSLPFRNAPPAARKPPRAPTRSAKLGYGASLPGKDSPYGSHLAATPTPSAMAPTCLLTLRRGVWSHGLKPPGRIRPRPGRNRGGVEPAIERGRKRERRAM